MSEGVTGYQVIKFLRFQVGQGGMAGGRTKV
jgi:hypothetical protein